MKTQSAIVVASIAWMSAVLLAPIVSAAGGRGLAVTLVYSVGAVICHQRPERSFFLHGHQLPVCARCAGLYVGAAIAGTTAVATRARRLSSSRARQILAIAAIPALLTLLFEWSSGVMPANGIRAATGIVFGAAVMWLLVTVANPDASAVELH